MPRIGRKQSATGIYHVMLRGINRQDIFEDEDDYWTFIRIIASLVERLDDKNILFERDIKNVRKYNTVALT